MSQVTKAVISGFVIAVVIFFFLPTEVSFLAYFLASIIAVYFFEVKETKDALLVAFAIYIFVEWIFGSIAAVGLLLSNETISYTVDVGMVVSQILATLFILLGGILGSELATRKGRRAAAFPSTPIPVPPSPIATPPVPAPPPHKPITESEEKKFCRYCGAENKTDAVFCERCGRKIE